MGSVDDFDRFDLRLHHKTSAWNGIWENMNALKRSARIMSTDVCMFHLDQSSKTLRISLDGATYSKLGTLITHNTLYRSCKHAAQAQTQESTTHCV